MSLSNHHAPEVSGGRLLATMSLNFVITIAEIVGGVLSGSLSLISDHGARDNGLRPVFCFSCLVGRFRRLSGVRKHLGEQPPSYWRWCGDS